MVISSSTIVNICQPTIDPMLVSMIPTKRIQCDWISIIDWLHRPSYPTIAVDNDYPLYFITPRHPGCPIGLVCNTITTSASTLTSTTKRAQNSGLQLWVASSSRAFKCNAFFGNKSLREFSESLRVASLWPILHRGGSAKGWHIRGLSHCAWQRNPSGNCKLSPRRVNSAGVAQVYDLQCEHLDKQITMVMCLSSTNHQTEKEKLRNKSCRKVI